MATVFHYIVLGVPVALLAAFVVLLVKKWGIAEWMQIHGDKVMSQLFACDFCMSFWASMILCMFLAGFTDDATFVIMPMFTTPITRMLV